MYFDVLGKRELALLAQGFINITAQEEAKVFRIVSLFFLKEKI